MPTLLLIRHGHVEGIAPERFRSRLELNLTARGRGQVQAVAAYVRRRWPGTQAVYASPLSRCQDTAAAIATPLGLTVRTMDGLNDLDYGAWQGLTHSEAAMRWPGLVDRWFVAPHRVHIPDGETLLDLAARASRALATCLDQAPAEATIAVVAHDSVNRVLLCEMMGLPLAQYWRLRQDPCCVNVIQAGVEFRVALLNGIDHLADAPEQDGGDAPATDGGAGRDGAES
ncbi:histidine phosphatase family protein [Acidiphilium sp.]|uniref:histidine phosphatase family protein n=1 Tax=Acidiphilium sp. TaxID=527 RepID=UPI00258A69CE|nr:histidine phosphatase family protein [Acidiphilium sp.]